MREKSKPKRLRPVGETRESERERNDGIKN
jgi:hypothetical protein